MKNLSVCLIALFAWQVSVSQSFCDSIFSLCDSITIDSAWFMDNAINGDKIFFTIQTNHHNLYAPSFVICPSDESITFDDAEYGFFSIFGPSSAHLHYYFSEFDITGLPELDGRIINDNSNNTFPHCELPFTMVINGTDGISAPDIGEDILMFPNPATNILNIIPMHTNDIIKNVRIYDVTGKQQELPGNGSLFNTEKLPAGMYVLYIELQHNKIIIKNVMID